MKRLLRSGHGRSSSMEHQNNNNLDPPDDYNSPSAIESPHPVGRSHSLGERAQTPSAESELKLPSSWTILDDELRSSVPYSDSLASSAPNLKTTIYSDIPLPSLSHFLQYPSPNRSMGRSSSGRNLWRLRRRSGDTSNQTLPSSIYPTFEEPTHQNQHPVAGASRVYYYEVAISVPSSRKLVSPSDPSLANVEVMIGFAQGASQTAGIWPGEIPSSIGWGSAGLYINGRKVSISESGVSSQPLYNGDVIGCGIEIGGMQRAFFTRNGALVFPPNTDTAFLDVNSNNSEGKLLNVFPVIAFQNGTGKGVLKSNFGLDSRFPFRWLGNETLDFLPQQPGGRGTKNNGQSVSMGDLPEITQKVRDRPISPSPYSGLEFSGVQRDSLTDSVHDLLTKSAYHRSHTEEIAALYIPSTSYVATEINGFLRAQAPVRHIAAVHGTHNTRQNLEDDDPAAAVNSEHFRMQRGNASSTAAPNWLTNSDTLVSPEVDSSQSISVRPSQISPTSAVAPIASSLRRLDSTRRRRGERGQQGLYNGSSSSTPRNETSPSHETPLGWQDSSSSTPTNTRPSRHNKNVVALGASGQLLKDAKSNSTTLLSATKNEDPDFSRIRSLLDQSEKDQQQMQVKLNAALEEADAIVDLEELFAVNDDICSAIEVGKKFLKQEKGKRGKKSTEGPTIEVLVENKDIFTLICMLRSPGEKRLQAALALMIFAKDDQSLSNEIRSSGGMHSFLTLFRTRGMTRELQVVTSMAVAHTLPSFVACSQTSPAVGLKIIECLRFLVTANTVSPNDILITRQQMCHAASMGVNVLWINAVQPLLTMEKVKSDSQVSRPSLNPSQSIRLGRAAAHSGRVVFDQGIEAIEIFELAELAVKLVAHLIKLTNSNQVRIEMGYDIVEQICEVDQARPIAVREGLLAILVEWIRSGDINKIRPAASALRYLISTHDKYMAGWIHSQVVNEGAINEIVKLLNESVGHDVRVAVSQMLSALCIAPHTRAAVVEANCVSYLVALLYEHTLPDSEEMVCYAGNALLQLAASSMMRGSGENSVFFSVDSDRASKRHDVIDEIIEGWAHGSFVQIAMTHTGKLRSVSVEALRVLSEDTSPVRKTRLQLCGAGAAEALGTTIKNYESSMGLLECNEFVDDGNITAIEDTYEALRALANILEPNKSSVLKKADTESRLPGVGMNPRELLLKGCMDTITSGGLTGILRVSSFPITPMILTCKKALSFDRTDLLEEACRILAHLSPLLLSNELSSTGVTSCAIDVLETLDGVLKRASPSDERGLSAEDLALNIDALKGISALGMYEPLKIRIMKKTLPRLLRLKSTSGDRSELSTVINHVLLSLGFTEDEIAIQIAGNNPQLLVDWFCLQRSLLLQAMARAEIRAMVLDLWQLPFSESDTERLEDLALIRQISQQSESSVPSSCESDEYPVIKHLFSNFTSDYASRELSSTMARQYIDVYKKESTWSKPADQMQTNAKYETGDEDLLSLHVYPLNDINEEKDWILDYRSLLERETGLQKFCVSGEIPRRVEKLLDTCFPSRILRNDIVPIHDLSPHSSFDFRALMMPKRRFFSFRREGQLLARLCEKQAKDIDDGDVYWTLGFSNSTFAGEFVESLVQTLYLCPMIRGLSFIRTMDCSTKSDIENEVDEVDADDSGGLLANLAGSLPPWVTHLTFDNMLFDRDLGALVAILDTMGRLLSVDQEDIEDPHPISMRQAQGKFSSLCIQNSPQISRDMWSTFFNTLGQRGPSRRQRHLSSSPLSSLKILDLSGNKMGDEAAALVLELVHDKDSGCTLEKLDLSGNRIGRGTNVVRVLCAYTEYYRYNQTVGVKMMRKGWKSSLHTLILAENDLFLGQAGLEILALLKHNALCLRFLDLSKNSLEGDTYQLLASSLLKNTELCHLNLSGNKFSSALIDLILVHLNAEDADSGLSFLLFENNTPALNNSHRASLAKFLRRSRKNAIERYNKERETGPSEAQGSSDWHGHDMDGIDDDSRKLLARTSTLSGRPAQFIPDVMGRNFESEENMITVLFSAPLVFSAGANELHPFAKLDFEMERELLWQCMKEASRDIEMSFDNAHHSRLLATLTRRCSVLHYSGHGHPNFLPFEDGMGGPNWLDVQDIKELILQDGVVPFKFVFVSACHSGLAGETFASAGVPHVVCCKQESELKDTAALAFTRSFYLALLVGHTVKESFEQGCKAVRLTPNLKDPDREMKKFVLLPKDGNHNVPVFRAKAIREWPKQPRNQNTVSHRTSRRRGSRSSLLKRTKSTMALGARSSELSVRNMMQEDPSPTVTQFFLGREVDMYYVISALLKLRKRLVTIVGETGIGRSSLVCSICHYINERASTIPDIQHIYFIKPKHGGQNVSCRSLLRQLVEKLEENGKCRPYDEDADTEGMLNLICRSLKQDKCLIVFDRTELLEKSDESQELPMILSTILYETKQVKIIITARCALGQSSIGGQVEHPYPLGPLTYANTVKLFANLCPHLHTPTERGQLFQILVGDEDQEDVLPGAAAASRRTNEAFAMIGNGVPAQIEKCAYGISHDDLYRLKQF